MSFKAYHGRTGRIFIVTKSYCNQCHQTRNILLKRININIEHIKPSKFRSDFLNRVKFNDKKRNAAKTGGQPNPSCTWRTRSTSVMTMSTSSISMYKDRVRLTTSSSVEENPSCPKRRPHRHHPEQ
ncbi:hypothetical protein CRE_07565 [Caenorhabditis remanei]|uniref:60S ribosomal protein L21 n=1 Tax=Caenorhabditis remanei TaxID=31234 RepID=E3MP92_CAERE|nr:hypothetical protein CRE_07565 [Caenorhabditis remanei]